jgi:hypothetical protein
MLSTMLPRLLGAYEAWRFNKEYDEERVDLYGEVDPRISVVPEDFHMSFAQSVTVDYHAVLEAVKVLCARYGALVEIIDERKEDINTPPRAIVEIRPRGLDPFRAVVFVQEGFVSFFHVPT